MYHLTSRRSLILSIFVCRSVADLITGCADYLVNDVVHYLMYPTTLAQGCHILHAIISHGLVVLIL